MHNLIAVLVGAWSLWATPLSRAEEVSGNTTKDEPKRWWTLSGYVDTYGTYNPNRPLDASNFTTTTGTSGKRANEFSINQAVIGLSRPPEPIGFNLFFGFGTGFDILHASEATGPGIGPEVWRQLLTATVDYKVPIGRGLLLEAGVFPSNIGFESFPSKDNWTYTRSWMAEFSPYYQTGIYAKYAFSDTLSAQLHLINGWQRIGDNNEAESLGFQVSWDARKVALILNGFAGPEGDASARSWRLFIDFIGIIRLTERLTIVVTSDFGRQERAGLSPALWYAAAADTHYLLTKKLALTVRVEGYRDETGLITGTAQTLVEATGTLELKPMPEMSIKLEARADHSTAPVFSSRQTIAGTTEPQFVPNQALVVLGAVVTF